MTPPDFRKLLYFLPNMHLLLDASGTVLNPHGCHAAPLPEGRNRAEGKVMRQLPAQVRRPHHPQPRPLIHYNVLSAAEPTSYEQRYPKTTHHFVVDDHSEVRYILQREWAANAARWFLLTT